MATWPTITDDDGSNTTGTIANNANIWNPIRDYIGTAHTTVAHSAGNFTGSGTITWTVASGDQTRFAYVEIGKTMIVSLVIATSSVSGTGTELRVAVPNGRTASNGGGAYSLIDNGTSGVGRWLSAGGTYLAFYNIANANWSASTDNTYIYATCVFEIA